MYPWPKFRPKSLITKKKAKLWNKKKKQLSMRAFKELVLLCWSHYYRTCSAFFFFQPWVKFFKRKEQPSLSIHKIKKNSNWNKYWSQERINYRKKNLDGKKKLPIPMKLSPHCTRSRYKLKSLCGRASTTNHDTN